MKVATTEWESAPAIQVAFTFPADYYVYANFSAADSSGGPLELLYRPSPDRHDPDDLDAVYDKPFAVYYAAPEGGRGTIHFQGCRDTICFMPKSVPFVLEGAADVDAVAEAVAAADGATPDWAAAMEARPAARLMSGYMDAKAFAAFLAQDEGYVEATGVWTTFVLDPTGFFKSRGWLVSALLILLGGFLLNLTPCVLPMIPVNLAIIGVQPKQAEDAPPPSRWKNAQAGIAYGGGMALVYGGLGLVVVLFGTVFGAVNASPIFNLVIAMLFVLLALAMFDVWQLDLSRFRKGGASTHSARIPAAFVLGGVTAVLAGACVAPVLMAVLALAGRLYAEGIRGALFLPFLLGIGMALPWPLLAAGLAVLPKPGNWMNGVKKVLGLLILLLAVYYAWNALTALRVHAGAKEAPEGFVRVDLQTEAGAAEFAARMQEALAADRPVLLEFTAQWCKACHLMNVTVLRDAAVRELLNGMSCIQVVGDYPDKEPARAVLQQLGVQGYPAFLLIP